MQNLTRKGVVPELSSFQCSQDQLEFSLSDQSIFNSNSTNIKKILFLAFFDGNTCAAGFERDFWILASSFWTQCTFLADFAGNTY